MDKNPQKNVNCIDLVRTLGQLVTFLFKTIQFCYGMLTKLDKQIMENSPQKNVII